MNAELLWQFDLTWALSDLHLPALVEDDFSPASGRCPHWEPASLCWTVRPDAAGVWRPDWSDTEPDPIALWLNAELMKNIAEIGQLRLLRAAGT
jgi:hypothetical protein